MKLIDSRYKVDKVLIDSIDNSIYEVIDFWKNDKRSFMKLYNKDRQKKVIEYFINNFIKISKIKHPYLLTSQEFSIINTINRRKVNVKQYYSTTEYINAPTLDKIHNELNLNQKLNIIIRICIVLDFLHYRGIVYRYLSPSNIFVLENNSVKIMDLANILESHINTNYDDLTRYFIAPEVILSQEDIISRDADKYSLGMLMIYLLTNNFYSGNNVEYEYIDSEKLKDEQIEFLNETITNLIKKNPITRRISFREIIEDIKKIFHINYEHDLVKERGILNFRTKIVGREKEMEKILKIDDDLIGNKKYKNLIIVEGETGVGKSRLLKEISYQLTMRGRDVYYSEINQNNGEGLSPITNILRQTIKDAPPHLLDKYGRELARVLPELKHLIKTETFNEVKEDRERLRLFDRIANYLEEFTRDKPMYLIIDNIDDSNMELLHLLDYLINNINEGNIILILSFINSKSLNNIILKNVSNKTFSKENVEIIKIPNLDLSEIGEFIQQILGISYKPLKFSAVMLKESRGNPRYIEYMIKNLFATGELFLHPDGFWEIKTKKYSDIYFPSSVDEAIKSQIDIIKKDYMEIMKVVSIYNDSISKMTLLQMIDIDTDDLNKKLDELIGMRLLDVRVSDWGYSYSINNIQLKRLIYHKIPQDERIQLHRKIVELLEKDYREDYKIIMDELIYHLTSSHQFDKAIDYVVKEAKKHKNIYSTQSIILWEEAHDIVKNFQSDYKIEILETLGKIYFMKGDNDKASNIYEELFKVSISGGKIENSVLARIGIGEIYLKKGLVELALTEAKESAETSKDIGFLEGIVKSHLLLSRIILNDGRLEEVEKHTKDLLDFAIREDLKEDLGNIYNIAGLVEYYKGNMENAISYYKKSIESFHNAGELIDSTKPMNNIANIYSQYGQFNEAMDYYEKGLNIVEKYGILNIKMIFLNNIGEVYMSICDYSKAKEYVEDARTIAIETEDTNIIYLSNINLGLIYLFTDDYEQSYSCYTMLKEMYRDNHNLSFEVTSQYYNFLGQFYFTFGKWKEALIYSNKTMAICKEYNNKEYLMSKSRIVLINYFKDGVYDKNTIDKVRSAYRDLNLNYQRRYFLLNLALIPFLEGDYLYIADILQEDKILKKSYPVPNLDYIRRILIYGIEQSENSYSQMIKLEEDMKKHNLLSIDLFTNTILGFKFAEENENYQAINYLFEALDLMYRLIRNVPDKDLQVNYIKFKGGDGIKDKLGEITYNSFNKKIDRLYLDDLKKDDSIEKYFDTSSLLNVMKDRDFDRITEINYLYEETIDIFDIETLIPKLTNDYEYNLRLILKYLAKGTLAQNGYILIYDEETNKYLPIVSLNDNIDWVPNENLLSLANRYEKGVLINNSLGNNVIGLYKEFLPEDIKALICIPISIAKFNPLYSKKDRRRGEPLINQRNEGYIYLETGRVFNRFDRERHKLVSNLIQIIYINIENYKLKILSTIDKLTGTYTRKYFESEFNKVIDEARKKDESFALLMLDIDRFKNINDTYGHRKGDEVLSLIGNSIKNNIRSTDIVARYGGEEFIIILKNIKRNKAMEIGDKIREKIGEIRVSKIENPITVSVGLSMFPDHSQFKEELIEKADQALYQAKNKGRNRLIAWDVHLSNTLNRMDRLAGILSENINKDQRNILALLDIIDLIKEDISKEEKKFLFLGRVIETLEAENCVLIELDKEKNILETYSRSRMNKEWVEEPYINKKIVSQVINSSKGEFLIDWESANEIDIVLNTPNWQSLIVIPLIFNGITKAILYISTPIKEKEFDYNHYNLAKVLGGVFSPII